MDMRRVLSLLSTAVLLLLAVSCADDAAVMSELDAAESVMEDSPETALAILDTMQRSRLVSREAIARHALLYSQALDKNYIDMTTDSIIRPAVGYYSRHGSADERLKAQYYLGCIYRNSGDPEKEMECYVRAERYVDEAGDYKAVGRLYSAIKALLSAAHAANIQKNYFSADSILGIIEKGNWKDSLNPSNLSGYYSERLILSEANDSIAGMNAVQMLLNNYLCEVPLERVEWGLVADAYIRLGEVDSAAKALQYYSLAYPEYNTKAQYHLLSALVKARSGDYVEAYNSISEYLRISDAEDMMRIQSEAKFIAERYNNRK